MLVQNSERAITLRRLRGLKAFGWVGFASICGVGLWISHIRSEPGIFAATLFPAVLGLVAFSLLIAAKERRLQTDSYVAILPLLLRSLDTWSIVTRRPARQIARMPGHYFVPRDEIDCDFHIEGSMRGIPFSVTQAVLTRSPGDETAETTFRGLIVWTLASTAFPGDFAALRRPPQQRSLLRGTMLPDGLIPLPNTTHLGRWAYDFVTTELGAASTRLKGMVEATDALLTLKLEDLPQVAIRGSDIYVLLPAARFGWDGQEPVPVLDVEIHLKPFVLNLMNVVASLAIVRTV
ncbi:hypothetical protein [Rhizobium sp. AAP43]|uniref:hypothetical protein n=1 Tax=Rhizobium sp. AAP43 TaxID=1523420 RepID=UPI0006B9D07E|nr:hypothetical protein [Rhizobium sp. AAP43]KPF43699.1 hypothetical protein IP76_12385 [Rhizobium sp. AAP43]